MYQILHGSCPDCNSSDAYCLYEDGHSYCYACETTHQLIGDTNIATTDTNPHKGYEYVPWRGITKDTMSKFNVLSEVDSSGEPQNVMFPYPNGRTKIRSRINKIFMSKGSKQSETGNLFGMDLFPAGSAKAITITEGELDAMSVFQMMGSKYPVVSLSSANSKKDIKHDYNYLNEFDRIYLCFDSDAPGQAAAKDIARLFDFNKVYLVKLDKGLKDANEYLQQGKITEFSKVWWAGGRYMPENIVSSFADISGIIDKDVTKQSIPYPFPTLNDMSYGIRTGEVVLFKAMEGSVRLKY